MLSASAQEAGPLLCSPRPPTSLGVRGHLRLGAVSLYLIVTGLFQAWRFSGLQFTSDIFISRSSSAVSIKGISRARSLSATVVEKLTQKRKGTKGLADKQGTSLIPNVHSGHWGAWQQQSSQ